MKSEIYLSAELQEDGLCKVRANGPANKLLPLFVEEVVTIFKELEKEGTPTP